MIIAIVNQKGGVGKTTTTLGLARSLAKQQPVLVVDIDPLAAATEELFGALTNRTVADVLAGRCELEQAIFATEDNIRLLPGSDDMEDVVTDLAADDTGILRLRTLLAGRNELVLIDCPAGLNALTLSAVIAANLVVVATIPEKWAVKGARKVLAQVNDVREALGFAPQIVGVVATMVRPTILHRHWLVELAAQSDMPFLGSIPLRGGRDSQRQLAADYDNLVLACGRLLTGQGKNSESGEMRPMRERTRNIQKKAESRKMIAALLLDYRRRGIRLQRTNGLDGKCGRYVTTATRPGSIWIDPRPDWQ